MSGIYIHIPFCKKACHYCDFHFSTSFKYKGEMIKALHNEILIRKDELKNENMDKDNNWKQVIYDEVNKKTQIKDYKIDVNLIHVMDDIPINWSMGMTTFEQSLFVADTDNHRINVYDLDTLKKNFELTSHTSCLLYT